MTDYLQGHAVVIESNNREIPLRREDLRVFQAVSDVFPGARCVLIRVPGLPDRPVLGERRGK